MDAELVRLQLAHVLAGLDDSLASATLYSGYIGKERPDADVLVVLHGLPADECKLGAVYSCFESLPKQVGLTWMFIDAARKELRTLGSPLTEIAQLGTHLVGAPLAALVDDGAPYSPDAVRKHCCEVSRRWVERLRERADLSTRGEHLAAMLEGSANVALMHHRQGRLTDIDGAVTDRGTRRLASLIGIHDGRRVVELIDRMRLAADVEFVDAADEVRRLIERLWATASTPDAPGCFIG